MKLKTNCTDTDCKSAPRWRGFAIRAAQGFAIGIGYKLL